MVESADRPNEAPSERKKNIQSRLTYLGRRFPPLRWLGLLFYPIWWLLSKIGDVFFASGRKRKLNKRRRRSKIAVRRARIRTWLARRSPPPNAHVAFAIPKNEPEPEEPVSGRFSRLVTLTALSSVAVLALAVVYLLQAPPETADPAQTPAGDQDAAAAVIDSTETAVPTLQPTATQIPTAVPTPTEIVIELRQNIGIDPLAGGGSIVYALHQNGNTDLYALNIGESEQIRLTNDSAVDEAPAWSPDGRRIAFTSSRSGNDDIYILELQSGEVSQITTQAGYDGQPSWSPDGEWLVYESYQDSNLDIYIVRVDLSQDPIRLTENPGPDMAPHWSPSTREIVWSGMRDNQFDIWLMSLDSVGDSRAVNLTQSAGIDEANPSFNLESTRLTWSGRAKGDSSNQIMMGEFGEDRGQISAVLVGEGVDPAWSPAGDTLVWGSKLQGQGVLQVGAVNSFGVVPQSFLQDGEVSGSDWAGVSLAAQSAGWLRDVNQAGSVALFTETIEEVEPEAEEVTDTESAVGDSEDGEAAADQIETPNPAPVTLRRVLANDDLGVLSDSVDQSFLALRSRVEFETGVDLLGDIERMFVPINAATQPGEGYETWHRAGRAFDINNELALGFSPILEIVRRDDQDQTSWEVFVLADKQDGTQGRPLTEFPWDFRSRFGENPVDYDEGGRLKDEIPSGYYVSLTELARDYGWEPVPSDRNWRTFYPGVRFWQFEKRDGLSWEEAMLEIYNADQLESR